MNDRWRRFGSGMLLSILIVAAWSVLCFRMRSGYTGPFSMELYGFGIFNIYFLTLLAQIVACLLLARRKTLCWSLGAVSGTVLGAAGPSRWR